MTTTPLPIAAGRRTRAALLVFLRPERKRLAGAITLLIAGTVAGLLAPPLLGHIVDLASSGASTSEFVLTGVGLVAVALVDAVLAGLGFALLAQAGESTLARIREGFVESALRLPLEQVERAGAGDLTSRVTNDVTVVGEAARSAVPEFTRAILTIVLTLGGMAVLDWRFLVAALVAVPVQAYTVRWYARRAVPLYARQRVAVAAQQHHLLATIDGAPTIRTFRIAEEHSGRVAARSQQAVDLLLQGIALMTRFYARLHVAEFAGLAAVLATGFFLVRGDAVSIGTATAAALYFHGLFNPINTALALVDDAQAAASGLDRLIGVADLAGEPRTPKPVTEAPAAVVVSGLGFAYHPDRPVLRDVDLVVRRGERVAVVGSTGAGKTSLAKVIAGVHDPVSGTVEVPAGEVALITQEVHVFAGPLIDDLRLARPGATDDEVRAALAAVDAAGWVAQLPDGLATEVGAGGHTLTAAQAQQVAFARLILADPPVAILDEATAEAGSAGARLLERVAAAALEGRTALIVAHRLTQAVSADRVVVLEQGRVVQAGPHATLIEEPGPYATLWQAWSGQRDH
ncbi:multidrug ABC transporter permease [Paractinoplanes abujensis]|uniref:ATP-binding cassette subfamily C protein n=1 Tax=Paractinoplanes abujensis TaxID=882441 RepID=A0A7W7CUY7_9ACTN|nr:ABC transporter ATP-binding protein [Actinoplanes abujensis]MBB4695147.1 ATP-binding cassette subfamily C protein [Actinoplanes abujensis]GID23881.1 multidrug ABC transporter permease [Actinoplanes abujensis]